VIDTEWCNHHFDATTCTGCMACMRVCPTQAIRVTGGSATMLKDRCIDCGECFKVCARGAVVPLTNTLAELSAFAYKVAVVSPTLFVQFDPRVTPGMVLEALKRCGFDEAVTLSPACEEIAAATELYVTENGETAPLISTFCPAVVRLIQARYPDLLERLLPLLSPSEYTAKLVKRERASRLGITPEEVGVVSIAPCSAKLHSAFDSPCGDSPHGDSAVSVRDIYPLLPQAVSAVRADGIAPEEPVNAAVMSWAFLWSRPRSVPVERSLSVAGLPSVIRVLDDIEKDRLTGYAFIECHACPEGCVSGALTVENPYVARSRAIHLMQSLAEGPGPDREVVARRYREGDYHRHALHGARPSRPSDPDISTAIARIKERERIASRLPGIDCGACGAPTCHAFAEDVAAGRATKDACPIVRERRIANLVEHLSSMTRPETGGRRSLHKGRP
jgi:iron only hydrogenase large subunit-like protein